MDNVDQFRVTYKYRIYPNKTQEKALWDTLSVCKGVHNIGLTYAIDQYKKHKEEGKKKYLGTYEIRDYIDKIKKTEEFKWMSKIHSQVLQDVSGRLFMSFSRLFKGLSGFPKYKNMDSIKSFTYHQSGFKIREDGKKIKLSGIGEVTLKYHRPIVGKIKTCTVKRNNCNQWFVCFSVVQTSEEFYRNTKYFGSIVGIDLGLEKLLTISNGIAIDHPHFYKKDLKKIQKLSKRLSNKKKGSKNRKKARLRLAKAHLKIYNRRLDFLWKLSNCLVNLYQVIGLEEISPKFMYSNTVGAQSAHDASWSMLIDKLRYQSLRYQTILGFVNPAYTSIMCSNCGNPVKKDLSIRIHNCNCGLKIDRDLNAAINIKNKIPDYMKYCTSGTGESLKPMEIELNGIRSAIAGHNVKVWSMK